MRVFCNPRQVNFRGRVRIAVVFHFAGFRLLFHGLIMGESGQKFKQKISILTRQVIDQA